MSYIIKAVIANPNHPEYGVVTVPFPISDAVYAETMDMFRQLEVGDPIRADCKIDDLDGWPTVLKQLEGRCVNVEELDYLAKRLDSFDEGEAAQFQCMASKLGITEMADYINLTFCCQQTTVVTDFSDLEKIGKDHYMNLMGGSCPIKEWNEIDGVETAYLLFDSGEGKVTPYGVVYDNGMKMEQLYDGVHFPEYHYEPKPLTLEVKDANDSGGVNYLYLPMPDEQIERLLRRAGYPDVDVDYTVTDHMLPPRITALVERQNTALIEVNHMCQGFAMLEQQDLSKLDAVIEMAQPEFVDEVGALIKNLEMFDYVPDVTDAESYGRYMIQESGHFEYDPNLDEFYDYVGYGNQRLSQESGMFTRHGYISYHGTISLDELMMEDPVEQYQREQGMEMGGMA